MKRTVIAFLILGALIPVVLLTGQAVLLHTDPERVSDFRALWYYIWPTAVFLMAAAAGNELMPKLIILAMSIIGNMVVYAVLGLVYLPFSETS